MILGRKEMMQHRKCISTGSKVLLSFNLGDALKKLLDKVEKESSDKKSGSQEFEGRLK